jgi:hypothetical protein
MEAPVSERWPLDGPEPPETVLHIVVGPEPWHAWRRVPCGAENCAPALGGHYHWFNGDRLRTWALLANRAAWPYATVSEAA